MSNDNAAPEPEHKEFTPHEVSVLTTLANLHDLTLKPGHVVTGLAVAMLVKTPEGQDILVSNWTADGQHLLLVGAVQQLITTAVMGNVPKPVAPLVEKASFDIPVDGLPPELLEQLKAGKL
jgi:hypothetical protein